MSGARRPVRSFYGLDDHIRMGLNKPMRIMAVDFGDKRIGLAISDPDGGIALPLDVVKHPGSMEDAARLIADRAREEQAALVVVGLPLNMDDSEGDRARRSREFGALLTDSGLEVELFDERLTSWEVEKMLVDADVSRKRRKQVSDKLAATLILRGFIEWRKQAR